MAIIEKRGGFLGEVEAWLATVAYKPGWVFSAHLGGWQGDFSGPATVVIQAVSLDWDAENPGRKIKLIRTLVWHEMEWDLEDDELRRKRLFHWLVEMERHEVEEWLKVGGVRVREPTH